MAEKRKIKIAFFADILVKDFDGASRTMYQIIERIPRDEFEFLFFCGMPPKNDIGHEIFKVPSLPIPFNSTYRMAIPLLSWFSMRRKIIDFRPDIIHIASPSPLGGFALQYTHFKRKVPVITIYHTHFLSYIGYYLRLLPFLVKPATKTVASSQKRFYDKSDLMYIPTKQMVKELSDHRFDTSKMKIWQRGMNHDTFNTSKKDKAAIRSITGNDKPNIIFASRLVWEKNLATLIRLFRLSKEKGDKYNFIVVGDGVAQNALAQKMPGAYMLGKVDHERLSMLYASSDAFVFPSISETYGNVVVEAMACGCPCIIAKGGGSQSLVEHGVTGFLCEPNNEYDYFEQIEKVISDEKMKKELIANGLEFVKQLDWDVLVDKYFADIKLLAHSNTSFKEVTV